LKYVYGPVPSRRLGRSLGVNLTPLKTCTYNCVYCQLGKTTHMTDQRQDFFPPEEILKEIKNTINKHNKSKEIDYITFVGEGEPTLSKSLGWLIDKVKQIWDIPVAVDTNGSLLYRKDVRKDLLKADIVMPSLDAGTQNTFRKINRPVKEIEFETIIQGMELFRKEFDGQIWLEIMLVKDVNDSVSELKALKNQINKISPDRIYINTPIRPQSEAWAVPPGDDKIKLAHEILGNIFKIIDKEEGDFSVEEFKDPIKAIESIARRHPMREEQVLEVLEKFDKIDLEKTLKQLIKSNKVIINKYEGTKFIQYVGKTQKKNKS